MPLSDGIPPSTSEDIHPEEKKTFKEKERKYLPTLADLLDRLSICQLKEVFIKDKKKEYAEEIQDIVHDIDLILEENDVKITAELLRALVVMSQTNTHIWYGESNYREGGGDSSKLRLTHSLNGIRNTAKNVVQGIIGHGRKDYKIDCLASEFSSWQISWNGDSENNGDKATTGTSD